MKKQLFDMETVWQLVTTAPGVDAAQVTHPARTSDCPSLARFPVAMTGRWTAQERQHVSGCSYCRRLVSVQWRETPPNRWALAAYKAKVSPDEEAMKIHLAEPEGEVSRHALESSRIVALLARLIESAERWKQQLSDLPTASASEPSRSEAQLHSTESLASEALAGSLPRAVLAFGRWPLAGLAAPATLAKPQVFQRSADDSLDANLRVTDGNELRLWVRSSLPADSRQNWKVRAAVVFEESDPLTAEFDLKNEGRLGYIGEYSFEEKYKERLALRMDRPFALVVEWMD